MFLLPLETLPGWPEAPELSAGFYIMLMIILPLVFGLVTTLLAFAPQLARRFRKEAASESMEISTQ